MVKKWIIVCGALGLVMATAGCASEPQEPQEGLEITGTTAQADESGMWRSCGIDDYRFNGVLNHVTPNANLFAIQYGEAGSALGSSIYSRTGVYTLGGFTAGKLFSFQAFDCTSGRFGGLGSTCSSPSAAVNLYSSAIGTHWALNTQLPADQTLYEAGHYVNNGVNVAVPFCAASHGGGMYAGYYRDGACNFAVGNAAYAAQNAVVLVSPGNGAHFSPCSHGLCPSGAMIAGSVGGRSLYGCQAAQGDALVPGWTTGTGCTIAGFDGQAATVQGSVFISGALEPGRP